MKRIVCLIISCLILLCLFGCGKEEITYVSPAKLFYCTKSVSYNSEKGVIDSELREFADWKQEYRDFLNVYLSGPRTPELKSPFPLGGWILELKQKDSQVNLLLNLNFSFLSPNELTLACACISLTVMELMQVDTVNIQIDGNMQDPTVITMTKDNLFFTDNTLIHQ